MIKLKAIAGLLETVRIDIENSIMNSRRQVVLDVKDAIGPGVDETDRNLNGIRDKTTEIEQKLGRVAWDVSAIKSMGIAQRDNDLAHDENLAAVVIIPYRGKPTLIKDGNSIDCTLAKHISLDYYSDDRIPSLEVER